MMRRDPNEPGPEDQLIADAGNLLDWLIFATGRIDLPYSRYYLVPGDPHSGWSYTRAAMDLAEAGVTWDDICRWKR